MWCGQLEKAVLEIIEPISLCAKNINYPDHKTLISLCAIIQSFTLRHNQMQNGIGGFFAGACLNTEGATWLKDTTYIIYDDFYPNKTNGVNTSIALRENGALLFTPQEGVSNKVFFNTYSENRDEEFEEWYRNHYEETLKKVNSSDSEYLVFLHNSRAIVSILDAKYTDYIKVVNRSELKFEFTLHQDWLKKLVTEQDTCEQEGYQFTFNFAWH